MCQSLNVITVFRNIQRKNGNALTDPVRNLIIFPLLTMAQSYNNNLSVNDGRNNGIVVSINPNMALLNQGISNL